MWQACYVRCVKSLVSTSSLLVLGTLVLAGPGCVAKDSNQLRPPPDPTMMFPDAEVVLVDDDSGVHPDGGSPMADADAGVVADPDGGVPTYWRDIYPIVFARCTYCHANEERDRLAGVPPIVTYAHTQAEAGAAFAGQRIYERMAARVLNSQGTAGDMPQRGSPFASAMTLEERQLMARWAAAGAPEGALPDGGVSFPDASVVPVGDAGPRVPWSNGPVVSDAGVPGVRYVDVFANQGGDHTQAHVVQGRQTNYHCFVFTVPPHPTGAAEEFAFEFTPLLDQRRHIHHMEVYRQDPENPIDPVGNGGPDQWHLNTWWDCQDRTSREQLIANYVPGQPLPIRLPSNVGYRIEPGDRLMLEIHYDSVPPPQVIDMTGFRITTTSTQPGIINAGEFWVGPLWNYDIAPATNNTMDRELTISSECTITAPVTVFWVRPHMHERGLRQEFWIRRAGGATVTTLASVDPWDPGNQPLFELPPAEQQFRVGDVVGTRCQYRTEGRNLIWGSGSNDEMCFFNMIHFPYTFPQNGCFTNCRAGEPGLCPVEYMP